MSITAVITVEQRPRGNIEIALDEMNGSVEPLKGEGNQKSGCANCAHHCALEPDFNSRTHVPLALCTSHSSISIRGEGFTNHKTTLAGK